MTLKETALAYLTELHWSVVPCRPGTKIPAIKWTPYQKVMPTVAEVEAWWDRWPNANIAVICGALSRVVCVDIDAHEAQDYYIHTFGEIHGTVRQTTGKPGGLHLLFRYPQDGQVWGNVGDVSKGKESAIEIHARGEGGIFIACPSIHPSGRQYQWVVDPLDSPDDIMELPADVKSLWGKPDKTGHKQAKPDNKEENGHKKPKDDEWVHRYLEGADEPGHPGSGEHGRVIGRDDACTRLCGYYFRLFDNDDTKFRDILYMWGERCRPPFPRADVDKVVGSIKATIGRETLSEAVAQGLISRIEVLVYPNRSDNQYRVYVDGRGHVTMTPADMLSQSRFYQAIFPLTGFIPAPMKREEWRKMINNAMLTAVEIEVYIDDTMAGMVARSIRKLANGAPIERDDTDYIGALQLDKVIKYKEYYYFTSTAILKNLRDNEGEKINRDQIKTNLEILGCTKNPYRIEGKQVKAWRLPVARLAKLQIIVDEVSKND